MNWTYDDANDNFTIRLGEFTAPRGIEALTLTEIIYMVKKNKSDPDVDALVTLSSGSGLTLVSGNTEYETHVRVQFSEVNFGVGKMESNKRYFACLGIKTNAFPKYLEVPLEDNLLYINSDSIHD